MGSSTRDPAKDLEGIHDPDAVKNPVFSTYNRVRIEKCTFDRYMGRTQEAQAWLNESNGRLIGELPGRDLLAHRGDALDHRVGAVGHLPGEALVGEVAYGGEDQQTFDHTHAGIWSATFSGAGVLAHSAPLVRVKPQDIVAAAANVAAAGIVAPHVAPARDGQRAHHREDRGRPRAHRRSRYPVRDGTVRAFAARSGPMSRPCSSG